MRLGNNLFLEIELNIPIFISNPVLPEKSEQVSKNSMNLTQQEPASVASH